MMKFVRICGIILACFFLAQVGRADTYVWTDPDGSYHATDRIERVPQQYQSIFRSDVMHYVSPTGLGFDNDGAGNIKFYDHSSPATSKIKRNPPSGPLIPGNSGSPVTPAQYQQIKMLYLKSGKEPVPEVLRVRVTKIVAPDTLELDNGQKVTFAGLEFPDEVKDETSLNQEIVAYEKKLLQGKTIHILFGPQRSDEKGRMLGYVFIGTDMFVNADLIMNGYAKANVVPPNTDYRVLYTRLQEFAKRAQLGIWAGSGGPILPDQAKNK